MLTFPVHRNAPAVVGAALTLNANASSPHPATADIAGVLACVAVSMATLLAGCTTIQPDAALAQPAAARWQAPLPHGGDTQRLADWWQRFDDPLLPALIHDAQAGSPSLAQAVARVNQARATLAQSRSATWGLTGSAPGTRAAAGGTGFIAVSSAQVGVDARWELDLFGGLRFGIVAAQARADQAQLAWHEARVSLAVELAKTYVGLRACEAAVALTEQAMLSQQASTRLTLERVRVGFEAPANGALAEAVAAESASRLIGQRADCDTAIKALVSLTGQGEPALRERLSERHAVLPNPALFNVAGLPADLLRQRPDLAVAERELVAAAAEVGVAEAQHYPWLSFSGNLGAGFIGAAGQTRHAAAWGFGPTLVLPMLDQGRAKAGAQAANARYDEARAAMDARLRGAVREVEEALVRLSAAQHRQADAARAALAYRTVLDAAQQRWSGGAASLADLEEVRRQALAAQSGLLAVQRDRVSAWIALYRALGGGWQAGSPDEPSAPHAMRN